MLSERDYMKRKTPTEDHRKQQAKAPPKITLSHYIIAGFALLAGIVLYNWLRHWH